MRKQKEMQPMSKLFVNHSQELSQLGVNGAQSLEAFRVDGPSRVPGAKEMGSFPAALLHAAQGTACQMAFGTELPVRLFNSLVEA